MGKTIELSLKTNDFKREEFKHYLESNGVIESLTKVFVRLVKERPENPLKFLRQNIGCDIDTGDDLQRELSEARSEVTKLRDIINNFNPQLLKEIDKEEQSITSDHEENVPDKQISEPTQSIEPALEENTEQLAVNESAN